MNRYAFLLAALCLCPGLFAQVNLGTRVVPKDSFMVLICMGHSNMDGLGESLITSVNPRAWMWDVTRNGCPGRNCPDYPVDGLAGAPRDTAWRPSRDLDHGRMATRLLQKLTTAYQGYYFGVLQLSEYESIIPKSYLRGLCWFERIKKYALFVRQQATIMGCCVMMGWDDGCFSANATAFAANFKKMADSLRAALAMPDLPFLIGQQERNENEKTGDPVGTGHGCDQAWFPMMVAQTSGIPGIVTNSRIVESWGPYVDDHHYTSAGLDAWADSAIAIMRRLGWGPRANTRALPAGLPLGGGNSKAARVRLLYDSDGTSSRGISIIVRLPQGQERLYDLQGRFEKNMDINH